MKARETLMLAILVLAVGILASAPADAGMSVDCSGVWFHGWVNEGVVFRLEQRLHSGPDAGSPIVQDDYIFVTDLGGFEVTHPWTATPDGWWYRAAMFYSQDEGASWKTFRFAEGVLFCQPPGTEGCTPGYWKNHLEDWPATGYSPGDDFDTTFLVDLFDPDITLDDAVNLGGGGLKKLARHGTAALLSAAHQEVDYPFNEAGVIALVQVGEVGPLADANELGCLIP